LLCRGALAGVAALLPGVISGNLDPNNKKLALISLFCAKAVLGDQRFDPDKPQLGA
jgi:hypothetical protein